MEAHTPLTTFDDPNGEYTNRNSKGSCISFDPEYTRDEGGTSELWVTVTSDTSKCALMDFEVSENPDEYYILMKGRVDGLTITPGYLGTRGGDLDNRNTDSYYLSATLEKVSTFKLVEHSDGYMLQLATNPNDVGQDYFFLAGFGSAVKD